MPERALGVDCGDDRAHLRDVGDVQLDRAGGEACAAELFDTRCRGGLVDVGDDDVVPARRQSVCDRPADALRTADDEGAAGLLSGCRWHR